MNDKKLKLLVAAGGTGGHLFPALAVIEQIKELTNGNLETEFVGNASRIEGRVLPNLGLKLHDLPISGLGNILSIKTLLLPFKIKKSVSIVRNIIENFQPDAVLAAGAYISYPAGKAAYKEKIPLFLMESNAIPGKTIRMLAKKAELLFTAFDDSSEYFSDEIKSKIRCVGNPVRKALLNPIAKEEARQKFGLAPDKLTALIFGGSLGARSINNATGKAIKSLDSAKIQFLWQTGKNYEIPAILPENVKVLQFIDDMASAYAVADLVVSRSGATSVAEICTTGKPAILVPYPHAANNHQEMNAMSLQEKGACILIDDSEIEHVLTEKIEEYIFDEFELNEIGKAAKALGKPDAAKNTAREIMKFLKL